MKYYLEYTLGWKGPSNLAAEKGTVVHKALEILAIIKLNQQNGVGSFEDEVVGTVDIFDYDLDDIIARCTHFYKKHSKNEWKHTGIDEKRCSRWTYKAIEDYDGESYRQSKSPS